MKRVKRRIFYGAICEQLVYNVPTGVKCLKSYEPKPRFKSEEERAAHRVAKSRRHHARLFNQNFSPKSLYATLTFDNDHEVHTFPEAKRIRDLYVRRLQHLYPDAVIMCYLGRGKSTQRIHMHMVSNGVPADVIKAKWGQGDICRIEHLRAHNRYNGQDYGQDYTGLANYLFDHWTPEQGGHRWKMTRTVRQPEAESPKEIKRQYSAAKPPIAPKGYMLVSSMETKYGLLRFKFVKIPPPEPPKPRQKKAPTPFYTDW